MNKPVIAGKSSRGLAWQHHSASSRPSSDFPAIGDSSGNKESYTQSTSSCQQASTSETTSFWRKAVQTVSEALNVADHTLAGIFGVDQSKYSLYESDLGVPSMTAPSSRQGSTTSSWLKWTTGSDSEEEEDPYDIEAPKHISPPKTILPPNRIFPPRR